MSLNVSQVEPNESYQYPNESYCRNEFLSMFDWVLEEFDEA